MSLYRISRLVQDVRSSYKYCLYIPALRVSLNQRLVKTYSSNIGRNRYKTMRSENSFLTQKIWTTPLGDVTILRISIIVNSILLVTFLKWMKPRNVYTIEESNMYRPINGIMIKVYSFIPFRGISRIWGWIASLELPVSLRPTLYKFYAKVFDANLDEIALELSDFPSLVEFFVRPLKYDARPIDQSTNIVSPADGTILYFGPVKSCWVQQVKGTTYNLRHFLGDIDRSQLNQTFTKEDDNIYIKSLLKNPANQLYQLTVYLAPGDYHRFHSPTDWEIEFRRHFQGKLLSVNPKIAQYLPDLFSSNERVIYVGKWAGGFMAYGAVGATNVGSIRVYCDKDLHTNTIIWPEAKYWDDATFGCKNISKGELFGEFRMGSTIVLLFEAPKDFKSCIDIGQAIKVGQALSEHASKMQEQ